MPFADTTKALIIRHRAYKIDARNADVTLSEMIDTQMASIERDLPELITHIEADLATLTTLKTTRTTERGSTSGALIRADVLEWSENKTGSIVQEYETLRKGVADMLAQTVETSTSGQARLYTG